MRKSSSKKYGDKQYWVFSKAKGFKGEFVGYINDYCKQIAWEGMEHTYKSYDGVETLVVIKSINDHRYLLCAYSNFRGEIAVKTYENKTKLDEFLRNCRCRCAGIGSARGAAHWLEAIVNGIGGFYADQDYCG